MDAPAYACVSASNAERVMGFPPTIAITEPDPWTIYVPNQTPPTMTAPAAAPIAGDIHFLAFFIYFLLGLTIHHQYGNKDDSKFA
ncbi:hypothetical protein URH17368_2835 [Alicyclobacillus hesperidum URH17-3-68]|nr:hypothetical protein URH17368_2835 [Alicyclobacillus hesperidum URH17-3-68]